ncbi:Tat (twin-arginine translocation) pathway signal sequence [Streptomyces melanosporofaciens]|uniref:Tat (Twin-arginine translocation) pathway signal sequence n=1 Tax=Streptomyces melanosporofaciens TaxID=67327 RepID=A0A1H4WG19_STRMJ|nr:Tat (twin-arginine translocation) pathway signal sequence [Streptomyces melanosporofaciens]
MLARRNLLKAAAVTGAAIPFSWLLAKNAPQAAADTPAEKSADEPVDITWLEERAAWARPRAPPSASPGPRVPTPATGPSR